MNVVAFDGSHTDAWDSLVAESTAGAILQTRRFLSYHGNKYCDASLCFFDGVKLIGVLPAARDPLDERVVISHPGITYGGLLHRGAIRGGDMLAAFETTLHHYRADGYRSFRYKAVPRIYHRAPAEDDLYALFRLGARRYRCDLSTAIDLNQRLEPSSRRKRALKRAQGSGLSISNDACHAPRLWSVLEENLATKHGVKPTHSIREIELLHSLFPTQIDFITASHANEVVAGIVLFRNQTAVHAQYIASSILGYETNALDLVFDTAIRTARDDGHRYFNFGISSEDGGRALNDGLFRFKSEFGGAGIVHEFYEIET